MPPADPGAEETRRVAALLLRDAREQEERAQEEGISAYLDGSGRHRAPGRVDERVLKGEVRQGLSFNRRQGVDAARLPALAPEDHDTPLQRERKALDREFVRRAHELRQPSAGGAPAEKARPADADGRPSAPERDDVFASFNRRPFSQSFGWGERAGPCFDFAKGSCLRENCRFTHDPADRIGTAGAPGAGPPELQRKRQRVGSNGAVVDIGAAEEEAARQAEEELELANPLMRGPAVAKPSRPAGDRPAGGPGRPEPPAPRSQGGQAECWASKKLRVRIVDEGGDFRHCHLKKGVVCGVDAGRLQVNVRLDESGKVLDAVPQDALETVVSKSCAEVEIVRGPARGMLGALVRRSSQENLAVVRLGRGLGAREVELPLDDVCEYA